eukprot:scaffold1534_cov267-Pinguiococcus_pyrenoidosus.AAC.5
MARLALLRRRHLGQVQGPQARCDGADLRADRVNQRRLEHTAQAQGVDGAVDVVEDVGDRVENGEAGGDDAAHHGQLAIHRHDREDLLGFRLGDHVDDPLHLRCQSGRHGRDAVSRAHVPRLHELHIAGRIARDDANQMRGRHLELAP